MIDESTEFGARAARRLREERVVWFTTVTPRGTPVPSPVWFLWEEPDTVLIFSVGSAARLRNIEADPRVSLHFDGDGNGGDIVAFTGDATIDRDAAPANEVEPYTTKYAWGFERIGVTPEQFAQRYSVPVRVRLTHLHGH